MLQNAYLLAKIGADTAEYEQHFAEILPKNWQLPHGLLLARVAAAVEVVAEELEPGHVGVGDGRAWDGIARWALRKKY